MTIAVVRSSLLMLIFLFSDSFAGEVHVSPKGNDSNPGTAASPLRTISKAARTAMPGDEIIVHAGTYREWVNPAGR